MVSLLWRCAEASLYRQSLPRDYAMSRYGVSVAEIGVERPTVSGKFDRSLKLRDGFIVHVLLLERLA
jgi:hypothetical protein